MRAHRRCGAGRGSHGFGAGAQSIRAVLRLDAGGAQRGSDITFGVGHGGRIGNIRQVGRFLGQQAGGIEIGNGLATRKSDRQHRDYAEPRPKPNNVARNTCPHALNSRLPRQKTAPKERRDNLVRVYPDRTPGASMAKPGISSKMRYLRTYRALLGLGWRLAAPIPPPYLW